MRTLKFRVWNKKEENWEIEEFNLLGEIMLLSGFPIEKLNDLEVMQYTDFDDKKGKEIYEGDIVSDGKSKGIVEYGIGNCDCCHSVYGFYIGDGKGMVKTFPRFDNQVIVIGNIYENPNLMKREKNA